MATLKKAAKGNGATTNTKKSRKQEVAPQPEESKKKTSAPKDLITLSDICKDLKISPATARVTLRKKAGELNLAREAKARYAWSKDSVELKKIIQVLTPTP